MPDHQASHPVGQYAKGPALIPRLLHPHGLFDTLNLSHESACHPILLKPHVVTSYYVISI